MGLTHAGTGDSLRLTDSTTFVMIKTSNKDSGRYIGQIGDGARSESVAV